jgi:NAD(P)-dependent dehydrogenase (short-subunit alcohol dehydrogenase family)
VERIELPGKVALVTGAARGIGLATAKLLHARGAMVAVVDLDAERAAEAAAAVGPRALPIGADVTDSAAMERAVAATVERFGGLDIVMANAGIAPPQRTAAAMGTEVFERVIEVDLLGVWRTVRPALPQIAARRGHVVVVASVYAFVNGVLNSPYAMAKAGVEQLGRALRVELRPSGASAGVAYFGFIDTDMVRDAFADPVTQQLERAFPDWMLRRHRPERAAERVVDGIERRAARTVFPRWWAGWSALRGIVSPVFDAFLERDERVQDAVRRGSHP